MNIATHISELLYNHDCVIIPGFGGFVCSYQPAEIHPTQYTVSPPRKAISFNKNLQNNDGLLVNHIATKTGMGFDAAFEHVYGWSMATKNLLKNGESIVLQNVGKFYLDIENNLQFAVDNKVNYLKTSYGLKTFTAQPVIHGKEVKLKDYSTLEPVNNAQRKRTPLRVAALIVLLIAMGGLFQLMYMGIQVKSLKLNEASVGGFLSHIYNTPAPQVKPIEANITEPQPETVIVEEQPTTDINTANENNGAISTTEAAITTNDIDNENGYFIIIGAFKRGRNVEAARELLQANYTSNEILVYSDPSSGLTKVGYYAGSNLPKAKEQLLAAQSQNPDYWLFKK